MHTVRGQILELVQDRRVSYSSSSESKLGGNESIVTWNLEPVGEHKTKVTLVHSGLSEDEKTYSETVMGWSFCLGRLAEFCPDRISGVIRKTVVIDANPDTIFRALTEPEQLTKWFPQSGRQGDRSSIQQEVGLFLEKLLGSGISKYRSQLDLGKRWRQDRG